MGKKSIFKSVRFKLIIIIVAIMAVPLITSTIISYVTSHSEATQHVEKMNTEQAKLVEHDFKSIVEQNKQILQTVANSIATKQAIAGKANLDKIQKWLQDTDAEVGDGNVIAIADKTGMQIVKSEGKLVDVSEREYFQKARDEGGFVCSDQNISMSTGDRICTFIVPVYGEDGKTFIGTAQRNYNLKVFNEMVAGEKTQEKQDIFIGDNNGDVIAHTSMDLDTGEAVNFADQQWYKDSRDDREAKGDYDSGFNGGNWKISYSREPITGWVTVVASDIGESLSDTNKTLIIIIIIGVVMLAIAIVLSVILSGTFIKPIISVNESIDKLARGEFKKILDPKLIGRSDEFGDIIRHINTLIVEMTHVVNNIKDASLTVTTQAGDLTETSVQIGGTTQDMSKAITDIARGATDQADTVERANGNVVTLSEAIQTVAENAEQLATAAADMNTASQSSADALKQLSGNMDTMESSVADITETMKATNVAVQTVNDKVDGITSIASQTNLLALNASIEAARAGEAGKGFAVVAEEIGHLATQSATTAAEIRDEMSNLLNQAQKAIDKTNEVAEIRISVNSVLADTVDKINVLITDVASTVEGIRTITRLTEDCDESKGEIIDAMTSLSAVSEQNAASTEQTSASMLQLDSTVGFLTESAKSLNGVAEKLNEELQFFKV
ncbi:MAG: methyl-accepting chemotaxis protein [Eubacterium sp.]|nr:methyl-accepting chemotaxis protein [Eubacterium sp.]